MQAVLATAVPVNELGLLVLKLGNQLAQAPRGRVLLSSAPAAFDSLQPGLVNIPGVAAESSLLADRQLVPLWNALGEVSARHLDSLQSFVRRGHGCQMANEECHKEVTLRKVGGSWVRLCWIHDHELADEVVIQESALRNQAAFWLQVICRGLQLPVGHPVSMPELCWWLTLNGWIDRLPESITRAVLGRPESSSRQTPLGLMDTDDQYLPEPTEQIQRLAKPVVRFIADAEPPLSFIPRPKPMRWKCEAYTRFVKVQPCVVCQQQADDPHHLIGHGQGKMGSKSHDLFTFPLCRQHHDELHRDVSGWERKHGSQLEHLVATLDRALKVGALE